MEEAFELFGLLTTNQTRLENYIFLDEIIKKTEVVQKAILDRKKNIGKNILGPKQDRNDIPPPQIDKKLFEWNHEDVFSFLKMINFDSKKSFVRKFIESEMYDINNLLILKQSSIFLKNLSNVARRRFLLNIMKLRECFNQEKPFNNLFNNVITKILRKNSQKLLTIEAIYSFCQFLQDPKEIKEILKHQEKEEFLVRLVVSTPILEEETILDSLNVEFSCESEWDSCKEYHVGILVGDWYLEWSKSEIVIPRIITNYEDLRTIDIKSIDNEMYSSRYEKITQSIITYNSKFHFDKKNNNSQHFIDTILKDLQITIYDDKILDFCARMRVCGKLKRKELLMPYLLEVRFWGLDECLMWLKIIGFDDYFGKIFTKNEITGEKLLEMTEEESFVKENLPNQFVVQCFYVYLFHLKRNVGERTIEKYCYNFHSLAKKFLIQQGKNSQELLENQMNYFDLEDCISKFSNKDMLHKYYFNFSGKEKIFLLIVKKKTPKTFHAGIMIGKVVLIWKRSEIIVPKFFNRDDRTRLFKVDICEKVARPSIFVSRISNVIIEYNSNFFYSKQKTERGRNSQHFVDNILEILELTKVFSELPKHADKYFDKIRKTGKSENAPSTSLPWKAKKIPSPQRSKTTYY